MPKTLKNYFLSFLFIIALLIASFAASVANAAVPQYLGYEGYLTDTNDTVMTGSYDMTFRIYDALSGGNLLWTETHSNVSVSSGYFSVQLGSVIALSLDFDIPYWISFQLDNDSEMTPRQPINAVGYANMSDNTYALTDADLDTTIDASTDDQIDIAINGADDFQLVANILKLLSGSSLETDTINETTAAAGVTIDNITLKDGGSTVFTGGTNTFNITNGTSSLDVAAGSALDVNANLTVESASAINQDLTTDASVTFAGLDNTDLNITNVGDIALDSISADGTVISLVPTANYGIDFNTTGSKVACDATTRGQIFIEEGGAGVADITYVCKKDDADAYAWGSLGGVEGDLDMAGNDILNVDQITGNSTVITIGDAGSTNQGLSANDDLFVSGKFEVDGVTYFDGNVTHDAGVTMNDDKNFILGSSSDIYLSWDLNGVADSVASWRFKKNSANDSGAIFFSEENPSGMTDHDDYLSPTFIITNSQGADTNDYSAVVIGERAQADVATTHYFDFYAMTGAVDGAVDATTTELAPMFRFGDSGSATSGHSLGSGDVLFEDDIEVNGAAYFDGGFTLSGNIDMSGNDILNVDQITGNSTLVTIGDTGATTNHSLTANDDLYVTGKLEVDGNSYVDGASYSGATHVFSGNIFYFTDPTDSSGMVAYSTTDETKLFLGSEHGRQLIITDAANLAKDHDHAVPTDPTIFIHSATDPDTDNTQWLSLSHDQTNGVIETGTGDVQFNSSILAGAYEFAEDAGFVTAMDMSVSATPAAGTQESYAFKIDGQSFMKIYSEADSAGGTQNESIRFYEPVVYLPSSDATVADDGAVTCTDTITRVVGSDADALLDTEPAINDGTEDGQLCIIQGTADANLVTVADAVNTALSGGVNFSLGQGDTLTLIWDSGDSLWYEISRSDN